MKAIIGSVHRSGSNFLAKAIADATGLNAIGEVNDIGEYRGNILADIEAYRVFVQSWLDAHKSIIHASPQYTYIVKDLKVAKKAFLVRNPLDHCLSKINFIDDFRSSKLDALISDMDLFYGYIAKGRNKVFKYEDIVDPKGIEAVLKWLKADYDLSKVDFSDKVNESESYRFNSLDKAISNKHKLGVLMDKIEHYSKVFGY